MKHDVGAYYELTGKQKKKMFLEKDQIKLYGLGRTLSVAVASNGCIDSLD